jgi:protein gp37
VTSIEWTDETWNPTVGCDRVSPGCDHCYAMNVAHRGLTEAHRGLTVNGPNGVDWNGVVRPLPGRLEVPFRWRRPRRIFVDSMSDLFHPAVPERFIGDVWNTMGLTPQHTYQILTKRPPRMAQVLQGWERQGWTWRRSDMVWCGPIAGPLPNVWLGTSIESSRYAFRADHLRATPAAVRFLSIEPMLDDCADVDVRGIDWVIVGGESGRGARPMHPDWVRGIRYRCGEEGIPFLFKQWGAWHDGALVGKHAAGRSLDGRTWDEYPSVVAGLGDGVPDPVSVSNRQTDTAASDGAPAEGDGVQP